MTLRRLPPRISPLLSPFVSPLLALFTAWLVGCGGSTPAPVGPAEVATLDGPQAPVLFRVTSPDGTDAYVMGTIHAGVSLEEALPGPLSELLTRAPEVRVEMVLDDPAVTSELQRLLLSPAPAPLSQSIGEEAMAALVSLMPQLPVAGLERFESWAAYFLALSLKLAEVVPTDPETGERPPGMDSEIIARTRARGARIDGLESPADIVGVLRRLEDAQYARLIVELAQETDEDGETFEDSLEEMIEAYRSGDLEVIEEVSAAAEGADSPEAQEFMRLLLDERTGAWMPAIRSAIARPGTFIAVGAGHVVGERGIVARLRAEGYSITRL